MILEIRGCVVSPPSRWRQLTCQRLQGRQTGKPVCPTAGLKKMQEWEGSGTSGGRGEGER